MIRESRTISLLLLVSLLASVLTFGRITPVMAANPDNCYALLIGISKYSVDDGQRPKGTDGQPLVFFQDISCAADIQMIQGVLENVYKISASHIMVLEDGDASRAGILSAFDKLTAEAKGADVVYIHYSGHGSQVTNPSEPNGLDTTIVPVDYRINFSTNTNGHETDEMATNEISGMTIREKLDTLEAEDHPKQVVLSFDSCHSGLATRGMGLQRGLSYKQLSDMMVKRGLPPLPTPKIDSTTFQSRGAVSDQEFADLTGAHYVVLSACESGEEDTQTANGNVACGPLSLYLSRAFTNAKPGESYRQIFNEVKADFEANDYDQHPMIDQSGPDTDLFGDVPATTTLTFSVTSNSESKGYQIDAGMFQDVTEGSIFALYPKNAVTYTDIDRIGTATIITPVGETTAAIDITPFGASKPAASDLIGAQAMEITHKYVGQPPIKFDAASVRKCDPAEAESILAALKQVSVVTTDFPSTAAPDVCLAAASTAARGETSPDIAYVLGKPTGSSATRGETAPMTYIYRSVSKTGDVPKAIADDLSDIARYEYALHLAPPASAPGGAIDIAVKLVPAQSQTDAQGFQHWVKDLPVNAAGYSANKDIFTVQVCNYGSKPANLVVLDLKSSKATVDVLWPSDKYTLQDNVIPAHSGWVRLWQIDAASTEPQLYGFDGPENAEVFKAIATSDYVDLAGLHSEQSRGGASPFDDVLGPAMLTSRAQALPRASAPTSWSAEETVVHVTN